MLYLLYSSGTTGKPKGIVHTTGGYLTQVASTVHDVFDLKDDDVYWCAADIGWVTGHSYIVYGPLANGATSILYEGTPDFPAQDRWWDIVEKYRATILYTAPTAIRAHMRWGVEHARKHDLSSLRLLGSVGEPINPEAWLWYQQVIGGGHCPVVDTWWHQRRQTRFGHPPTARHRGADRRPEGGRGHRRGRRLPRPDASVARHAARPLRRS
jgi:acetyl-CoA synthetase